MIFISYHGTKISGFVNNIRLWENEDQQNNPGVLDSQQWNNYWRGQFELVASDYAMKHFAVGFNQLNDQLKQEFVKKLISGSYEDQKKFALDYAASQWSDPVVMAFSVVAFADALVRPIPSAPSSSFDAYAGLSWKELQKIVEENAGGKAMTKYFNSRGEFKVSEIALRAYREIAKRMVNGTAPIRVESSSAATQYLRIQQINRTIGK